MSTAVNAGRIREFREQAATDRLVLQARRTSGLRRCQWLPHKVPEAEDHCQ
jgi:hypothetical protein